MTCTNCAREILFGEPVTCFICGVTICTRLVCCSSRVLPGLFGLKDFCPACVTKWQKYHDLLLFREEETALYRKALLEEWRRTSKPPSKS